MKLSVVTDEISSDFETALELAREWGLDGVEIRGVGEARFPRVSELWRRRVPELTRIWDMKVAALSPGLFKIPLPGRDSSRIRLLRWEDALIAAREKAAEALVREHLEVLLPETIAAAQALGATVIVCFSFERSGAGEPTPDYVVDALRQAARSVGATGLTLALEVEHVCWGDTAAAAADIVARVGEPSLGINWDPANAFVAGDDAPFPKSYAAVRSLVRHVHYKQASVTNGRRRFSLEGDIDWRGQVEALRVGGYSGWISVETHVGPKVAATRQMLQQLRDFLG